MLDNPELAADNFRIFLRGVRNSLKTDLAVYIAAPLDEKIMSSKLIAAISELGELALYSKGKSKKINLDLKSFFVAISKN